jgi:hypothetical protein
MKNKEAKSIFSSLENFSSIPPPELWDKIEAQLDEPKKKKRAIIWWSIAASLLVGLSVPTILYFKSNQANGFEINIENDVNSVVLQKDSNGNNNSDVNSKSTSNRNKNANEKGRNTKEDNGIANANDKINEKENSLNGNENANDKRSNSNNSKLNNNNIHLNNTNQVAEATILSTSSKTKEHTSLKNLNSQKNNERNSIAKAESKANAVVANQNLPFIISTSKLVNAKDVQANNSNTNNKVVVSSEKNIISESNVNKVVATKEISKSVQVNNSNTNNKSVVSNETKAISESNVNKVVATKEIPKSVQANNPKTNNRIIVSNEKNAISGLNVNNGKTTNTRSKDSLDKIKMEVARLENVLVELEKDKKDKKKSDPESIDKWSLQVFAGVMSSQNYKNEKSLGNTVASKQSNGYGVKTNYKLNKKWGVSSGFKINELGQKIAGVSYYNRQSSTDAAVAGSLPVVNDNYVPNSSSNYEFMSIAVSDEYLFTSNSKSDSGFEKGDVTQNLKYFEMPLEVSYAILSKKKTNIIMNTGGFVGKLISNDIALNGNSIGENKNVNQYVYGTLLSSTLQYEFYKKTKVFVEPGMNYYINPLENQSFNQFQWMFNVGLNVSF